MRNWRNIPVSGNFFRLLSIMDCRRVCLTGPIRRSLLRILPRKDTSCYDCDGVIWCLDVTDFRKYMPAPLLRKLVDTGSNIFTVGMLEKVIPDFEKMREMSDKPYAIFFEPSSMIDRIVNQYALFSVVSDPAVLLSDILEAQRIPCRKIIIPKEIKLEIRDKLDYINISERMIYPGLDGVCRWITRRYSALGPEYNRNHDHRE